METKLRIRIPNISNCIGEDCQEYTRIPDGFCVRCRRNLLSRVRQEVTPTALPSKPELVHGSPLRRYLCG